mgnify:CR=1 FL=1
MNGNLQGWVAGSKMIRPRIMPHLRRVHRTEKASSSMPATIYHLATCSTCQRILGSIPNLGKFTLREIKSAPITAEELDGMKELAGSYEALFSRRSMKYRPLGLHEKRLTEKDYRKYILQEYTFLKRPVMVVGDAIHIGNTKAAVEGMIAAGKKLK